MATAGFSLCQWCLCGLATFKGWLAFVDALQRARSHPLTMAGAARRMAAAIACKTPKGARSAWESYCPVLAFEKDALLKSVEDQSTTVCILRRHISSPDQRSTGHSQAFDTLC
ncbi:uncharacterized protein J3D65DRAFT_365317 [Phyllosticta citribraziliensis]|uniref:Uncharacterized protein n=1 Tax=Phyllosticta citribraziliensis TaxID=989973 RepID=A0ABR1LPJ1_9PEZI